MRTITPATEPKMAPVTFSFVEQKQGSSPLQSFSHPFVRLASQSLKPRWHDMITHLDALHPVASTRGSCLQETPHDPQLSGELARSVSHPFEGSESQSLSVPAHEREQFEEVVSTSQPLLEFRSQSVKPGKHRITHFPEEQLELRTCGRPIQLLPHRPHAYKLVVSASQPVAGSLSQSARLGRQEVMLHLPWMQSALATPAADSMAQSNFHKWPHLTRDSPHNHSMHLNRNPTNREHMS